MQPIISSANEELSEPLNQLETHEQEVNSWAWRFKNQIDASRDTLNVSFDSARRLVKLANDADVSLEHLDKFSARSKRKLIRKADEVTVSDFKVFIELLEICGNPDIEFINHSRGGFVSGFFSNPERPTERREIYVPEGDFHSLALKVSENFEKQNQGRISDWMTNSGSIYLTSLYILRYTHKMSDVTELLNRCVDEDFSPELDTIVKLLNDWENQREYPLTWSSSIIETTSEIDSL
jgi:hypothetical protein